LLELQDFGVIGLIVAVAVLVLYLLLRPKRLRHPVQIGRDLEERVKALLLEFDFDVQDRRKLGVAATPDYLVSLPNGRVGVDAKNVEDLSRISAPENEKLIQGCKALDAIPLYVIDKPLNYDERQGIPVIPIQSLVPVLKLLWKAGALSEFKDEFGVRQSVEELLQFENLFKRLFDKLRKVREAFGN
jgi:hypothetical protein